jgi:hypothetical protein
MKIVILMLSALALATATAIAQVPRLVDVSGTVKCYLMNCATQTTFFAAGIRGATTGFPEQRCDAAAFGDVSLQPAFRAPFEYWTRCC